MNRAKARSPRDWREERRLRVWALHQQGWMGKTIAEALGVSKGAVSQWLRRAREEGVEALYSQPPPGPTPRPSSHTILAARLAMSRGARLPKLG